MRSVKSRYGFRPGSDVEVAIPIRTEGGFRAAWSQLANGAGTLQACTGAVFSHASKSDASGDGLEFRPGVQDGTLQRSELGGLPRLSWLDNGVLVLAGCNTGAEGDRGWCPAGVMARRQGVLTAGQTGYAYFSRTWASYEEKAPSDTRIALWAYRRGKNGAFGSGERMPARVFRP